MVSNNQIIRLSGKPHIQNVIIYWNLLIKICIVRNNLAFHCSYLYLH